mmetsp:Transcript_1545/g.3823  ORF Transcript_1545/g.3823 Transcript_1545/m.3823 type:complete len:221 (-) Transcript_1545:73-735(-)
MVLSFFFLGPGVAAALSSPLSDPDSLSETSLTRPRFFFFFSGSESSSLAACFCRRSLRLFRAAARPSIASSPESTSPPEDELPSLSWSFFLPALPLLFPRSFPPLLPKFSSSSSSACDQLSSASSSSDLSPFFSPFPPSFPFFFFFFFFSSPSESAAPLALAAFLAERSSEALILFFEQPLQYHGSSRSSADLTPRHLAWKERGHPSQHTRSPPLEQRWQ